MSACAVACSSFYFAKGWQIVCPFGVCLLSVVSSFWVAGNVSGLGEVAEIEAQMFSFAQKFNRRTELEFSTKPAILPNPCYAFALFWSSSYKFSVIKSLQYALICCLTFLNSSAISSSVPVALAGSGKL